MSSIPSLRPIYIASDSRPMKDPLYLAWIRELPCAVPYCRRRSEAAHTGSRGLSQKANDRRAIPLCTAHHREYHRIGRRRFEQTYRLNIELLISRLNEKPVVSIVGSRYYATLGTREYELGGVGLPLRTIVGAAIAIARERPMIVRLDEA